VRILNMVGKTIQIIEAGNAQKTIIDITALSAGIYQVQMQNGAVRKFVVSK
jgi:Secretion system C-terminal sorting domain